MPTKETADEFQSEAEARGNSARIEPDETGGYNVVTDDEGSADKGDFVDTLSESGHESSRSVATREAVDDWDDALPDESPIGKTQEQLDEMERREQKRLGHDKGDDLSNLTKRAEKEEMKKRIREAKRGGRGESHMSENIGSAMKLMGVGKVNKSALSLYGVGGKSEKKPGRTDLYSGENLGMRELTSPRSFGGGKSMKPMTMPQSSPRIVQQISPIAAMSTQTNRIGISPLSVASLEGKSVFGLSPLAQESTKIKLKTSKIGISSLSGLAVNPAGSDMSKIARIAKQSSIIAPISRFSLKINSLKRGK